MIGVCSFFDTELTQNGPKTYNIGWVNTDSFIVDYYLQWIPERIKMKSGKPKKKSADVSLLSGFGGSSTGSSPLPRSVSWIITVHHVYKWVLDGLLRMSQCIPVCRPMIYFSTEPIASNKQRLTYIGLDFIYYLMMSYHYASCTAVDAAVYVHTD